MTRYKVGIVGHGFVGESLAFAFSPTCDISIYDINPLKSLNTLEETLHSDFVFVCVPTPMKEDGSQDTSYIKAAFTSFVPGPTYIIKSTIEPGTTNRLVDEYKSLDIIFSPEFLTERTSKLDLLTQARIILGGEETLCIKVKDLFEQRFMNRHYIITDSNTAEFIKYMNNNYFAVKVSLMNEYYRLAKLMNVNWQDALHGFASDGRITDSHLHVPGPDGKFGFGGSCFPKDINAMISYAKNLGVNMNILEAAWKTNLEVRPEEDWKQLKGRAVSI
jgi:UDPglucose 6-dehydrogenase